MQIKQVDGKWLAKKSNKAKTWEDVTDIIEFQGDDFCSVMGKAGRTEFHTYLGKSGGRWLQFHGVTSLLGYWGEKDKLVQWAVDRACDYVKLTLTDLLNLNDERINELVAKARSAHKRSLNEVSASGKDVHAEVEEYIKKAISYGGRLTAVPEGSEQLKLFATWAIENDVQFIASEKVVYSRKIWVAGTLDFLCIIKGKLCIGDIKTNNWLSVKHFFQCGGYAEMVTSEGIALGADATNVDYRKKIEGIVVVNLPRTGGIKVAVNEPLGIPADHTLHMPVEKLSNAFKSIVELVKVDKDVSSILYS